jgi:CubicO group peptidase (beta-lactamase class C family)
MRSVLLRWILCHHLILGLAAAAVPAAMYPGASWQHLSEAEAEALGWSRAALAEAREFSATLHTEAVMIVTGGRVLDEWGAVERKFNVHSIRKSLLSALCGLQVAEKRLNLDATMAELGIDDRSPLSEIEKRATVRQLLQARSGVYHPALYETARMKAQRPARHSHEPGTFWYYNNWDFNALGTIYEQAAGTGIYEDFARRIAAPLGMQDYVPADGSYVTGEDSSHRAYPFRLTARDLARFGLLYLRAGDWQGGRVLPEAWVRESLQSASDAGASGGYSYLWWTCRNGLHLPGVTLPADSYSARGAGGHYLLVLPSLDTLIVHRVNTDLPDRRVEAAEFGELVRRILAARRLPAPAVAAQPDLDTLLPLLMTRHRVPGVSVVAIENRRIAWERHFGARQAGQGDAVDAATRFEVASMTKPLAAHAALKLVEQGRLDLDRPLVAYLPGPYLQDEPLHAKITARNVLTHTSGFPNWRPKDGALKVLHEPGTAYRYSGEGFVLLQRVIEQVTGEDYETHLQRTLLQPLGMTASSHLWSESWADQAAAGHDRQGRVKQPRRLYREANAAYSLYTTARDYAAFLLACLNPDPGAAPPVSTASRQLMLTPLSPPTGRPLIERRGSTGQGDVRFGLGWALEPTASGLRVCHSGSNGTGFRSHAEWDPEQGDGLVILTNADGGEAFWRELLNHLGRP